MGMNGYFLIRVLSGSYEYLADMNTESVDEESSHWIEYVYIVLDIFGFSLVSSPNMSSADIFMLKVTQPLHKMVPRRRLISLAKTTIRAIAGASLLRRLCKAHFR